MPQWVSFGKTKYHPTLPHVAQLVEPRAATAGGPEFHSGLNITQGLKITI